MGPYVFAGGLLPGAARSHAGQEQSRAQRPRSLPTRRRGQSMEPVGATCAEAALATQACAPSFPTVLRPGTPPPASSMSGALLSPRVLTPRWEAEPPPPHAAVPPPPQAAHSEGAQPDPGLLPAGGAEDTQVSQAEAHPPLHGDHVHTRDPGQDEGMKDPPSPRQGGPHITLIARRGLGSGAGRWSDWQQGPGRWLLLKGRVWPGSPPPASGGFWPLWLLPPLS